MDKIKKYRQTPNVFIETQNVSEFAGKTGNMYESLVIISKRAEQIARDIKEDLHG